MEIDEDSRRYFTFKVMDKGGYYSEDHAWWWSDSEKRWYRCSESELDRDLVEIEVEETGKLNPGRNLIFNLFGQNSVAEWRFTARLLTGEPAGWEVSKVFPVMRGRPLDDVQALGPWFDGMQEALHWVQDHLISTGWIPLDERGPYWWSHRYWRFRLDPASPVDAYDKEQAASRNVQETRDALREGIERALKSAMGSKRYPPREKDEWV